MTGGFIKTVTVCLRQLTTAAHWLTLSDQITVLLPSSTLSVFSVLHHSGDISAACHHALMLLRCVVVLILRLTGLLLLAVSGLGQHAYAPQSRYISSQPYAGWRVCRTGLGAHQGMHVQAVGNST